MNDERSEYDEKVEDLDVTAEESEDVKGGISFNYSKVDVKEPPSKQGDVARYHFENAWPSK